MRRTFALAVTAALALLVVLGAFLSTSTDAAPAAATSSISGTLVATPQSTLPATLLLQVGGQTVPVTISSYTQVLDSVGNALSLSAMSDGDNLTVTGNPNQSGGIDATLVQDLSQNVSTPSSYQLTVSGTLATEFTGGLCLQNASVLSGAATPNVASASPCPLGELPVYLNGTTFEDAAGNAIALGNLQAGDSLQATGVLSGGVFTASLVQDLSQNVSTPSSYQLTVSGTLATEFTGGLCLQNASVLSGAATPNVATASPCPLGELPVYLNGTTFEDAAGNAIALGNLQAGDSLQATGVLSGGVFTASLVQDLSQNVSAAVQGAPTSKIYEPAYSPGQPVATTLVGVVQSTNFTATSRCFTIQVQQGSAISGTITICLQSSSRVLLRSASRGKYTAIHRGQTVTVVGRYNRHNHRWTSTQRVRIH